MNLRVLTESDMDQLRAIHEKYYKSEFDLPDFQKFILPAITLNDKDEIITAGGPTTIAEMILVTNKDITVRNRRPALYQILDVAGFAASKAGYDKLHVFVQDDVWMSHLIKVGFRRCRGQALYLNI